MGGAGVLHFLVPRPFDAIVPRSLPGTARTWTRLSGVVELGRAGLVAVPRTRRLGGRLSALLFVAVFPANVKMALAWRRRSLPWRAVGFARLPLQIPLVLWARRVGPGAGD
ncbi:hypothetical protein AB0I53_37935 [Saccharopolyspora sp. NPDC050389]|uniref:DoxX family protein n=1 Tax=Saccharopolyspora sp. NPDC050389 TaxID=3155516 RepID=UPI0033EE2A46